MSDTAETKPIPDTMRYRIENAIYALLTLLDDLDGDSDMEDGADNEYSGDEFDTSFTEDEDLNRWNLPAH